MPPTPKAKAPPAPAGRYLINAELGPDERAEWDRLCEDEAARTGQSRSRVGAPLLRRLIREEFRRRLAPAGK